MLYTLYTDNTHVYVYTCIPETAAVYLVYSRTRANLYAWTMYTWKTSLYTCILCCISGLTSNAGGAHVNSCYHI